MPYPYQNITRFCALRSNQLGGGDYEARDALYSVADVGLSMDGVEVPKTALRQDVLAQAAYIALLIGSSNNPVFRRSIALKSIGISNGDPIPLLGIGQVPFVGDFDGCFDDITDRAMSKIDVSEIRRRKENPGGFWKVKPYKYAVVGTAVYHTMQQDVYFRGCGWDPEAQAELYDTAGGMCPLPEPLQLLHGALVLANIAQEDFFVADAAFWGRVADYQIRMHFSDMRKKMPSAGTREEPVKG